MLKSLLLEQMATHLQKLLNSCGQEGTKPKCKATPPQAPVPYSTKVIMSLETLDGKGLKTREANERSGTGGIKRPLKMLLGPGSFQKQAKSSLQSLLEMTHLPE